MREKYPDLFAAVAVSLLWLMACSIFGGGQAAAATAAPARAPEKAHRLVFAGYYPDKHPAAGEIFGPWAVEIAGKTKNSLIVTCYGPDIFFPKETNFEAVRRGNAAAAQQSAYMAQGRLPFSSFLYVPGGISSSASGTAAFWRMFKNSPDMRREYESYKLISLHASPPVQLHLTFQVKNAEGLKGRRILCQDAYMAAMLKSAGALPAILPESAFYKAVERGDGEGVALSFDMVMALGLDELPFMQSVCVNICVVPYWTMMNKSVWEALPRELQRVIDAESGENLGMRAAGALDTAAAAGKARMAGKGVHIKELTGAESEAWLEALAPAARDLWLASMIAEKIREPEKILERAAQYYRDSEAAHGRQAAKNIR